ncbi:MAG: patatin-like phospholipase family protein [Spirochaetia bacterium]|nr:patatin-like phospholipase family protein [Spirochaetia bacterium]
MMTGLVMEGGAMRGMFTAGVCDVLMAHNIVFDGAIGVSAGATFGCNYKSRQIGRVIRYNKRFAHNWRYCILRSLFLTGD